MKGLFTLMASLALIGAFVLLASTEGPSYAPAERAQPQLLFPGPEVSLARAQQMVSFHVAAPTSLPVTFAYSSVRVETFEPGSLVSAIVYLIYSHTPLSSNTTSEGLLAAGGFFIVEVPEPETNPGPIIDAMVQQYGAVRVTINGDPGCFGGNQVHWWADGIHYALVSPFSESDMMAIAASMGT